MGNPYDFPRRKLLNILALWLFRCKKKGTRTIHRDEVNNVYRKKACKEKGIVEI